ncbi:MAG: bacillithiol biosynthesis cysteine-adding enzyme BshC [Bacteroidota bacterium]
MELKKLTFEETNNFSSLFLDYLDQKPELSEFYNQLPSKDGILEVLKNRSFPAKSREVLYSSLKSQNKNISLSDKTKENLELLRDEKTFTITTGHQLNIFTGPLYYIYKLVTIINTSRKLKEAYPEYNFVPVYWMATEDHDFDEISYFNLFGKKYQWETDQKGAVGKFNTASISEILDAMPEESPLFKNAYNNASCLADAVRTYVNELFGEEGLLVIDPDDKGLKSLFTKEISSDLFENLPQQQVIRNSDKLEKLGYKNQVFPREINFFFMKGAVRERIEKQGDTYQVLNTDISFSEAEMQRLIAEEPEVFSPNVILRPVFQETILPNLAYVGGPSELVYWLQLKGIFDHFNTSFPVLMPRNFALIVNTASNKKMDKIGLKIEQLFFDSHTIKKNYLESASENEFNLDSERQQISDFYEELKKKAAQIDGSLEGFIGAESAKTIKNLDNIEKRLRKSEERKHETALSQIEGVKNKLFPGGGLQERHDNFLNFYLNNPNFIKELLEKFDPFDLRFNILIDQ